MIKIIKLILTFAYNIFTKKFDLSGLPVEESSEESEMTFYEYLKEHYRLHGVQWDSINIFGLREETDMSKGVFNDYIGIAIDNEVHLFKGTCDPSDYWTKKGGMSNNQGVAHIALGYHKNVYMVGKHAGKYEALVQWGAPIKIWRDKDNNFRKDDTDIFQEGYFGTNIHRASAHRVLSKIGKYSAGCQVIQNPEDFDTFMEIVKSSEKYRKKRRRTKFSYFLMKKSNIPSKYLS